MAPDAGRRDDVIRVRHRRPPAAHVPPRRNGQNGASALRELRSASDRYTNNAIAVRVGRPNVRFGVTVLVALAVGVVTALLIRPEYLCGGTFRLTDERTLSQRAELRSDLSNMVGDDFSSTAESTGVASRWHVEAPANDLIRFRFVTTDRSTGAERATQMAQAFLTTLRTKREQNRGTPSQSENVVSLYIQELQTRAANARTQLDSAMATIPDSDSREQKDALLDRWRSIRSGYTEARARLAATFADVSRLRSEAAPTHGVVPTDKRREAFAADLGLQQDLRELSVHLTELRAHLLRVRATAAARFGELSSAVTTLRQMISIEDTRDLGSATTAILSRLTVELDAYRRGLVEFADAWNAEFAAVERLEVDPQASELLDQYHRIRALLTDYFFSASQTLSTMRGAVNRVGEEQRDHARTYVLQSKLIRAFQTLQSAHHRLEFAAGTIETPDNFRLDIALRSAHGLRRRSQDQMRRIETKLQARATKRAIALHATTLVQAEQTLEHFRAETDKTVDRLVAVQDGLLETTEQVEGLVEAVVRAELAGDRLKITQSDLRRSERRLKQLATKRRSKYEDGGIELVSAGVMGSPINGSTRAAAGVVAGAIAFLSVLFGQWHVARRKDRATP